MMNFPRNNQQLDKIFKMGRIPSIFEFSGEYWVDMLTGLPSLKRFSHRKVFHNTKNTVLGHNLLFKNLKWGKFFVEEGACNNLDSTSVVIINYQNRGNSFISNRIKDHVRVIEDNHVYLGRFNYILFNRLYFLGYFSLQKK